MILMQTKDWEPCSALSCLLWSIETGGYLQGLERLCCPLIRGSKKFGESVPATNCLADRPLDSLD